MDIVERLRRINAFLHVTEDEPEYDFKLSYEAADEIERLRGALSAIAISYSKDMPDSIDAKTMWIGCTHIARAALQQKDSE